MSATTTKARLSQAFAFPTAADLLTVCRMEGPCLSIFLPPHRAGAGTPASAVMLKSMLPAIARVASEASFLEPLETITEELPVMASHREALCIYRSARELHCFLVNAAVEAGWHLDDRCNVYPLLEHLDYRSKFFLLALAGNHIRLMRCGADGITAIPMPDGVPESTAEFVGDSRNEEHRKNHNSGIRFGSSDGRGESGHFRRDFMKAVDRGLRPLLLREALPLVLAGVPEETAAFLSVSDYPELLPEAVRQSPDDGATPIELARSATALMKSWRNAAERLALAEFEDAGPARQRTDSTGIQKEAEAGRVQHLFVRRGSLEAGAAAVAVLAHRGKVWLLEPDQMPADTALAAVLRYAGVAAGL